MGYGGYPGLDMGFYLALIGLCVGSEVCWGFEVKGRGRGEEGGKGGDGQVIWKIEEGKRIVA